jgi:hypothetical protein
MRSAYRSVLNVSLYSELPGEMAAIMIVLALPPSELFNNHVSVLSL